MSACVKMSYAGNDEMKFSLIKREITCQGAAMLLPNP
jgi:hypothetical protein